MSVRKRKTSERVCCDALNFLLSRGHTFVMDNQRTKKVIRMAKTELGMAVKMNKVNKAESFAVRTYNDIN